MADIGRVFKIIKLEKGDKKLEKETSGYPQTTVGSQQNFTTTHGLLHVPIKTTTKCCSTEIKSIVVYSILK